MFEHHPGLHALWLALEGKPQENLVRTTEEEAEAQKVEQEPKPRKVRRRKSARVFGEDD